MPYALYLENDSFYIQRWTDMEDIKAARRRLSAAMDRADLAKSLLDDARATYALARRNFEELRDEEDRAARDLERLTSLRSALGVGDPEEDPEGKRREDNRKRKAAPVPSPTSRARPFVVVVGGRETPFSPLSFAGNDDCNDTRCEEGPTGTAKAAAYLSQPSQERVAAKPSLSSTSQQQLSSSSRQWLGPQPQQQQTTASAVLPYTTQQPVGSYPVYQTYQSYLPPYASSYLYGGYPSYYYRRY